MDAEDVLYKVQRLKEGAVLNGFEKIEEIDDFFDKYWMQILDILEDALYRHIRRVI